MKLNTNYLLNPNTVIVSFLPEIESQILIPPSLMYLFFVLKITNTVNNK